ncbi:MAG: hypothetical protein A2078_06665 [Nitrospirae bacterium GWC2_57_9]|nr:MAG: hypothetical protein A2078_06665 [Nitrospirae bacterium GWC2_57_9]
MTSQILIADDDPAVLDWCVQCLSDAYRVVTAQTGRDAIEHVKRSKDIDLAVIDYRLADMSGVEAMTGIKDLEPSIPAIIITGYGDEDVAVESFRSGARDYLKKPFSISELTSKIDFYLALRHADKQRRKNVIHEADAPEGSGPRPPEMTLSQYRKVQLAVRFINDHYKTAISLDDAAREVGVSPAHFSRIFKKAMGLSYHVYLNNRRIAKAQNLLRTSAMSAAEIALTVGFADATGFGRIFKKLTGRTPSEYRNLPKK